VFVRVRVREKEGVCACVRVCVRVCGECVWSRRCVVPRACLSARGMTFLARFTSSFSPTPMDQTRQYTVKDADVGCQLRVEYTPVRADGTIGHAINIFTTVPQKYAHRATHRHTHQRACPSYLTMLSYDDFVRYR